jgi:hypothetical protein
VTLRGRARSKNIAQRDRIIGRPELLRIFDQKAPVNQACQRDTHSGIAGTINGFNAKKGRHKCADQPGRIFAGKVLVQIIF